jgi:hypothetical protein
MFLSVISRLFLFVAFESFVVSEKLRQRAGAIRDRPDRKILDRNITRTKTIAARDARYQGVEMKLIHRFRRFSQITITLVRFNL